MRWQDLEILVRDMAELKFGALARAENIAGVKCDCVIHLGDGSVVLIEMSKERSLTKLRTDLAKFQTIRPFFIQRNIFPRCFFVTESDPSPSLVESGDASSVKVFSVDQFLDWVMPMDEYVFLRAKQPFGSAVNLYSGEPDRDEYIPVSYTTSEGREYTVSEITDEVVAGRCVVLIGSYGSGKSRCISEIFHQIRVHPKGYYQLPLALNLRESWGLKRAAELINRHLADLGLGDKVPDFLKFSFSSVTAYLLDGFDEIGAQTWSDDPAKLIEIRRHSLAGVKELISRSKGGVLIAGREHYFNNDAEMIECLGLGRRDFLIVRCNEELTGDQFAQMVRTSTPEEVPEVPAWVPKKPLIAKIIREIDDTQRDIMFRSGTGQIDFWSILIESICEREARIQAVLEPHIIRSLYTRLSRLCRSTASELGPLSVKAINQAFEDTTGRPPTDESALILQRLPGLGRIASESLDRQFVDEYILDGLKAEDVLQLYAESPVDVLRQAWKHPIGAFGASFIATRISSLQLIAGYVAFIKRHKEIENRILLSDMLTAFMIASEKLFSFSGQVFWGGKFQSVNFAEAPIAEITFNDCFFDGVDITDANPASVRLNRCVIKYIAGATSESNLPAWISEPLVGAYQQVSTLAGLRKAQLSTAQTFLLSSLRKLFLQPGAGRRHSSMYKGYGDSSSKRICEKVISLLIREGFCSSFRGTTEDVYFPNRAYSARAKAMLNQMTQSNDEVWRLATRID